jgi:general secretion pathway protein D
VTGGVTPIVGSPGASPPGVAQPVAQLSWQGPSAVRVGDSFVLQLAVQSDAALTTVPLTLSYDTTALQVTAVTEGEFMRRGGVQTGFTSRVDAATGQIAITLTRSSGGATGSGGLFGVTFTARAAADEVRVQLLNTAPVGLDGRSVTALPVAPFAVRVTP